MKDEFYRHSRTIVFDGQDRMKSGGVSLFFWLFKEKEKKDWWCRLQK